MFDVGASVLDVLTESLYDKPLVVFREYVQNSVDSISKAADETNREISIWLDKNTLYFLDNGTGIEEKDFLNKMTSIGASLKSRKMDIGYKGIGRLSGISYCEKLTFVNIIDYKNGIFQEYIIDCKKYKEIRSSEEYSNMRFKDLMREIGDTRTLTEQNILEKKVLIGEKAELFETINTGFFVIMENLTEILFDAIQTESFLDSLSWMIPVSFSSSIYEDKDLKDLIGYFEAPCDDFNDSIAAKSFTIKYNNQRLVRPIEKSDFRTNNAAFVLSSGMGFISFRSDRIAINKNSNFNGIKIYLDNFLLCDEKELIPSLTEYGYTKHTQNELIQTVRGIGAMIYIMDKDNINANSRRTFIDVNSMESIHFMEELGELIERIYDARYKLSDYQSGKVKYEQDREKVDNLRKLAQDALNKLSVGKIELPEIEDYNYEKLPENERKKLIKKTISTEVNDMLKQYMRSLTDFSEESYNNAYNNFVVWLISQIKSK